MKNTYMRVIGIAVNWYISIGIMTRIALAILVKITVEMCMCQCVDPSLKYPCWNVSIYRDPNDSLKRVLSFAQCFPVQTHRSIFVFLSNSREYDCVWKFSFIFEPIGIFFGLLINTRKFLISEFSSTPIWDNYIFVSYTTDNNLSHPHTHTLTDMALWFLSILIIYIYRFFLLLNKFFFYVRSNTYIYPNSN